MKYPYTVGIQLKSYARKYMIEFYGGEPVKLFGSDWKDLLNKILDCLQNPTRDREKECRMNGYIETKFAISSHDIFKGRFVMTNSDMVRINKRIEDRIKWISRLYITESKVRGTPIKIAILEFQEKYNLHEDDMSFDLIYKDFLRSQKKVKSNPLFKINF